MVTIGHRLPDDAIEMMQNAFGHIEGHARLLERDVRIMDATLLGAAEALGV